MIYTFERTELERIKRIEQKRNTTERQREFKDRMAAQGFQQIIGWIHPHQRNDVIILLHYLAANPDFMVGPVRHTMTGRLHKLR